MISVLVPTYKRPEQLEACLVALTKQSHPPDEIVVVRRDSDTATEELLNTFNIGTSRLVVVVVDEPGVIHAMSEGLKAATGEYVALTDDDAVPEPDWIEKILAHFNDLKIVGVGGRDILPWDSAPQSQVGMVSWSGKAIGNHHCGVGPARQVDILKGVNCAFRRADLVGVGFDQRLLGAGAQVHWEAAICLALRRKGGLIIYDPGLTVHHFPGERTGGDDRVVYDPQFHLDASHNGFLVLWEHLGPFGRFVFRLRRLAIGARNEPGILLYPFSVAKFGAKEARQRFKVARQAERIALNTAGTQARRK